MNPLRGGLRWIAKGLSRAGVIDNDRGERTADLAWPRMVTGFALMSRRVVDFAMVGAVLGPPALAGIGFALAYWGISATLSHGLSGGTISQVSQRYGAGDDAGVDRAVKQSIWLSILISVPLTVIFWTVPEELIGLLGGGPETVEYGAAYLQIASLGIGFEFLNKVASRALVGADDSHTPMWIRGTGAVVNIVLNTVFIFGLGLGVVGAALGTFFATAVITAGFAWGFLGGRLPVVGAFPVRVSVARPYVDRRLMAGLVTIGTPLMVRGLAGMLARFPLLAIVATFGPVAVAAYEVSRRVRGLITAPNWGFSLTASSLVGQALGKDEERTANAYGWEILWFSIVVHLLLVVAVITFAHPIAAVFVDEPGAMDRTVPFIRIAAIGVLGFGIDGVATGTLRGSGDTRWPLYGKLVGMYVFALPVAYAGIATPLGIVGIYLAMLLETFVPAVISLHRFRTGRWIAVSRTHREVPGD